jgi:hypothetical protein
MTAYRDALAEMRRRFDATTDGASNIPMMQSSDKVTAWRDGRLDHRRRPIRPAHLACARTALIGYFANEAA